MARRGASERAIAFLPGSWATCLSAEERHCQAAGARRRDEARSCACPACRKKRRPELRSGTNTLAYPPTYLHHRTRGSTTNKPTSNNQTNLSTPLLRTNTM
ncbi:uncharacterized protein K452DRAFT_155666 [Aplosporella prunicola CBS 121167]|uniref:Uncharacterized protein n=1 Tax=Aplosporella prunicola CBS 121167 TaxID=1176127 RepID=A0A6A6BLV1_9PEZI|nr:uncharacterized protein K452DRAFT_155666 [Aplosporella prunicola CBS 121167]KAF2144264.1 hypothetical protein K452DRAFT_155666 [Aplosporella prunicola CBS 121167]